MPGGQETVPKMLEDTWVVLGHAVTSAGDVRMS